MEFVNFSIAKKLKEKGFRDNCIGYYDYAEEFHYNYESAISNKEIYFCHNKYDNIWHRDIVDTPTIAQVLKWLRNSHKIHIEIVACAYGYNIIISKTPPDGTDLYFSHSKDDGPNDGGAWDEYEEAVIAGIEYVIDNLI